MSLPGHYPLRVLQVETTNWCNARCITCPHSQFKSYGTMDDALYTRIVDQAATLNPPLDCFIPMLTGEPLLDPKICDRIVYARTVLGPHVRIDLYTNGSLLKKNKLAQILSMIPNVRVNVSVNGVSQKTRQEITGLDDYQTVLEGIQKLEMCGIPYTVSMVRTPEVVERGDDKVFAGIWGRRKPGSSQLHTYLLTPINFSGYYPEAGGPPEPGSGWGSRCRRAEEHMTVLWTGKVNLCCMDPFGDKVFGDLNTQTVQEVWESEERQRYIRVSQEGNRHELPVCTKCNHPGIGG